MVKRLPPLPQPNPILFLRLSLTCDLLCLLPFLPGVSNVFRARKAASLGLSQNVLAIQGRHWKGAGSLPAHEDEEDDCESRIPREAAAMPSEAALCLSLQLPMRHREYSHAPTSLFCESFKRKLKPSPSQLIHRSSLSLPLCCLCLEI